MNKPYAVFISIVHVGSGGISAFYLWPEHSFSAVWCVIAGLIIALWRINAAFFEATA